MTNSINYNHVHSSIEIELHNLQTEKAALQEQLQQVEQRLSEISSHETKLQRVFDSLGDLLGENDLVQAASLINPAERVVESRTNNSETTSPDAPVTAAPEIEPAAAAKASASVETAATAIEVAASPVAGETLESINGVSATASEAASVASDTPQPKENTAPATIHTQPSAAENEPQAATTMVATNAADASGATIAAAAPPTASANDAPARQVSAFDPADFFAQFPHIQRTHPVHVLARKLLEYFERGLKLSEIARMIEQLGYKHESRNFVDSVHSALKNKRAASGEFRYNRERGVWELGSWETPAETQTTLQAEGPQQPQPSKHQAKTKADDNRQPTSQTPKAGGKKTQTNPVGGRGTSQVQSQKRAAENGVKVYKREQ